MQTRSDKKLLKNVGASENNAPPVLATLFHPKSEQIEEKKGKIFEMTNV